jgi:hypothetical protein
VSGNKPPEVSYFLLHHAVEKCGKSCHPRKAESDDTIKLAVSESVPLLRGDFDEKGVLEVDTVDCDSFLVDKSFKHSRTELDFYLKKVKC